MLDCRSFRDPTGSRSGQSELSFYHFCFKASVHMCPSRQEEMILLVRESMECIVRPPVSVDEAPRTPEQTNDQPHLTAAVKTSTAQTAPAKGTFRAERLRRTHLALCSTGNLNSLVFYWLFAMFRFMEGQPILPMVHLLCYAVCFENSSFRMWTHLKHRRVLK